MKKYVMGMILSMGLLCGMVQAGATYTFSPSDADLADLPHEKAYAWGIQWTLPDGEQITSAQLVFKNIYDWTKESNDHLYVTMLDSVTDTNGGYSPNYVSKTGYSTITKTYTDNEAYGNYFGSQGTLIADWNDPLGGSARNYNLTIDISDSLFDLMSDGNFGFGIDPDCHYYNSGVVLTICTGAVPAPPTPVPAPGAVLLGGIGVSFVGYLRRRRSL